MKNTLPKSKSIIDFGGGTRGNAPGPKRKVSVARTGFKDAWIPIAVKVI